jgi:hypothetical protein
MVWYPMEKQAIPFLLFDKSENELRARITWLDPA